MYIKRWFVASKICGFVFTNVYFVITRFRPNDHTQTPCGFRLVGTAFSSWRGLPIILRDDPGFGGPEMR